MILPLNRYTVEGLFNPDEEECTKSVCLSDDVEQLEKEFEDYKLRSVTWDVEDFLWQALLNEDVFSKDPNIETGQITMDNAKEYLKEYDPETFEDTLHNMIYRHDASIGITWDTIDYYLDVYCKIKEFKSPYS